MMKDINYVIKEVAKRTGKPEEVVAEVVRASATDCREFMSGKKGYSIYYPRLGTFTFRVTGIRDYIMRQRRYMAYWSVRLGIGHDTGNHRTIEAAEMNIDLYRFKIKHTLLIKQEFLDDHATYHLFKVRILQGDVLSDIARLEDLYNVEEYIQEFKKRNTEKALYLQNLSDERKLPHI